MTRNLSLLWFKALLLCLCMTGLTGCGKDDSPVEPPTPFHLDKTYYEVRFAYGTTHIDITNGSGNISVSVENENVVKANYVVNEGTKHGYVALQGWHKGTSHVTLTDNVTGDKQTIEVKVTDCYLAYDITESDHPALAAGTTLFLINNDKRDCYFFTTGQTTNQPIAQGTYDIYIKTEAYEDPEPKTRKTPYLVLNHPSDTEGNFSDVITPHDFRMDVWETSPYIALGAFETYLGVDWEELGNNPKAKANSASTRDIAPQNYGLQLSVPDTDYVINGEVSLRDIPEHVLD